MPDISAPVFSAPVFSATVFPLDKLRRLAGTEEMRAMDRHAIEKLGLPGRLLMENAARAVADRVSALCAEAEGSCRVVVCCGAGNNGGDGYAVARLLANRGLEVTVVRLGQPAGADARANAKAWNSLTNAGKGTLEWDVDPEAADALDEAGVVVDALFGTGLNRPVTGAAKALILRINTPLFQFSPAPRVGVVGVDVPSGVNGDTGAVIGGTLMGGAVRCTHTVCLQAGKPGCHQYPGLAFAGRVEVADVSIPPLWEKGRPGTYLLTGAFAHALLPHRPPDGHKGSFGHLLALCGSSGMAGAAYLAGAAAMKTGAGLVTLGVPANLLDRFVAQAPELMTLAPPTGGGEAFSGDQAPFMLEAAESRTAVVLGCGLGRREETGVFVRAVLAEVDKPLLVDADGLYHSTPEDLKSRGQPTVITPHPGELARLSGLEPEALASDRIGHARRLAAEWNLVLVLKGAATVVAAPEGDVFINPTGDHALASGGTGDVLSGIIGSLLSQGMAPLPASLLGVYLHGLARDCQIDALTAPSFTAQNLIEGINGALKILAAE